MPTKLSERDKADLKLLKKARKVARLLGCGYYVVGVGPGVLFSSHEHPRYPIDMPEALVLHLLSIAEDCGEIL